MPNGQLHAGVLHFDEGLQPRLLHLAFHARTVDDSLPHRAINFWWVQLKLLRDRAETVAALCRRIAKRAKEGYRVPYGIHYEGGRFTREGIVELAGREVGFTCATFVLAVLESAQLTLLALDSWPSRDEDRPWHRSIVDLLIRKQTELDISEQHIKAVEEEQGCARYRPEEVAGACSCRSQPSQPITYTEATPPAVAIRTALLSPPKPSE